MRLLHILTGTCLRLNRRQVDTCQILLHDIRVVIEKKSDRNRALNNQADFKADLNKNPLT
jgi:hypothetical protein